MFGQFVNQVAKQTLAATCVVTFVLGSAISASKAQGTAKALPPKMAGIPVKAIFEKNCLGCHGVGGLLSGFDLRTRPTIIKGGVHGAAIIPGSSKKSLLYQMVTGERTPKMPPNGKLTPTEIAEIGKWIDAGAGMGEALTDAKKQVWWSFKPPVQPNVPSFTQIVSHASATTKKVDSKPRISGTSFQSTWIRNPIDAFILDGLVKSKMVPSPIANRRSLMRRATFDLTGLPPTPEEMDAYLADHSPDAYPKLIDRLLASSRYGERWGRHWLDLARYADSGGFEGDKDRANAWRYRDFVIDALNKDLPYNRFVSLQVAGDELAPQSNESIIATGFIACGPVDIVMINAQNRANELDDIVSTTGSAFLGLTVGCARCHDHKYDPITQADYYRLSAVFAPSERRDIDVPTAEERAVHDKTNFEIEAKILPIKVRIAQLAKSGSDSAIAKGNKTPNEAQIAAELAEPDRKEFKELGSKVSALEATRPGLPQAMAVTDKGKTFPPSYLLVRGDSAHPGPEVKPGFICSLPGGEEDIGPDKALQNSTGRRSELAKWLTVNNPLLARVWVNRVWRQHFGRGIVDTPSNFGVSGQLPSHPELLDWLAVNFEKSGWSTKQLQRWIMVSSTYQQGSAIRSDYQLRDPLNRQLWRMPVRREEGEVVRDSILYTAGTLNKQMGGPPVYPPVDPTLRADTFQGPNWQDGVDDASTWRRSVYVKVKRSLPLPELDVFDCPEITNSVAARNVTTSPTQALTLMNAPFVLHQSSLFAQRVAKEAGLNRKAQINRAYMLAFQRMPTDVETKSCLQYLNAHKAGKDGYGADGALSDLCHALYNFNEFIYAD